MSTALKIGVIGLGRMGQLYARTLATQVSGVHLYAVANLDEHARKQVAEEFGVSHVFADAYELIALPELDAVVIATPTNTHHDLVIAAADAGKAIFCEKPMRSPPARLLLPPRRPTRHVTLSLSESFGSLPNNSISFLILYACLCEECSTPLIY